MIFYVNNFNFKFIKLFYIFFRIVVKGILRKKKGFLLLNKFGNVEYYVFIMGYYNIY